MHHSNTCPTTKTPAQWPLLTALLATLTLVIKPAAASADTGATDPSGALATAAPAGPTVIAARPRSAAPSLGVFGGAGYLASPGAHGAAFDAGLRLGLGRYLALSFDLGFGLLNAPANVQDRWWLMPAVAVVIPAGPVRVDLGAGVGLATASGFANWTAFVAEPFTPTWAFQLNPAVRAHVMVSTAVTAKLDVFARIDAGMLMLDAGSVGFRGSNAHPGLTDTSWVNLWLGFRYRVL